MLSLTLLTAAHLSVAATLTWATDSDPHPESSNTPGAASTSAPVSLGEIIRRAGSEEIIRSMNSRASGGVWKGTRDVPTTDQDQESRLNDPSSISVSNRTASNVEIYWISPDGTERHYVTLSAGDKYSQPSFIGHLWVAIVDGRVVSKFVSREKISAWFILEETSPREPFPQAATPPVRSPGEELSGVEWPAPMSLADARLNFLTVVKNFILFQSRDGYWPYSDPRTKKILKLRLQKIERDSIELLEGSLYQGRAALRELNSRRVVRVYFTVDFSKWRVTGHAMFPKIPSAQWPASQTAAGRSAIPSETSMFVQNASPSPSPMDSGGQMPQSISILSPRKVGPAAQEDLACGGDACKSSRSSTASNTISRGNWGRLPLVALALVGILYLASRRISRGRGFSKVRDKIVNSPSSAYPYFLEYLESGGAMTDFTMKELMGIYLSSDLEDLLLEDARRLPPARILELAGTFSRTVKHRQAYRLLWGDTIIDLMAKSEKACAEVVHICACAGLLKNYVERLISLKHGHLYAAVARACLKEGKGNECVELLRRMTERNSAEDHMLVAALKDLGREQEAVEALLRVPISTWTPGNFETCFQFHLRQGQFEKVKEIHSWAEKIFPLAAHKGLHAALGRLCEGEGASDIAVEIYRRVLTGDIDFEDVMERYQRIKKPAVSAEGKEERQDIIGRYKLLAEIDAGAMGVIYQAHDTKLDRRVAIKRMRAHLKTAAGPRKRFLQEAKSLSRLTHPSIVGIHDVLERQDDLYLVMEYVEGQPLSTLIMQRGRMSLPECKRLLNFICQGVDCAHAARILHRDLKPSNIMVDSNGHAKVMDFGLAWILLQSSSLPTQQDISGTLAYMAPEQHHGKSRKASDVYSLGVCLYEMLTGQLPFKGPDFLAQKERKLYPPPNFIAPNLPKEIEELMDSVLEPDPKKRIGEAMELLARLKRVPETPAA